MTCTCGPFMTLMLSWRSASDVGSYYKVPVTAPVIVTNTHLPVGLFRAVAIDPEPPCPRLRAVAGGG